MYESPSPQKNKQTNKMMLKVSNRNTRKSCLLISKIKSIRTTSPDYSLFAGGNCPDPYLGHFFLEYIPICNQNLLSVLFWRPIISIIADPYLSFYEKWEIITEIFDSWKIPNVTIFYFWKNSPKNGQIFQLFTLYSKGRHFRITKSDILIFCNILHLEMDSWNLSWKRIVFLNTFWPKSRKKHFKWVIEKIWKRIFNDP